MKIDKSQVVPVCDKKFIRVFDLQYKEGKHYFDATRRSVDNLVCIKDTEAFKAMRPDAVSCVVILDEEEPKLILSNEYRYPAGQFLLSVPAGLMDPDDQTIFDTAQREIKEECGLSVTKDTMHTINPLLFSTPGMSDESNALVCVLVQSAENLNSDGTEGSELFDGYQLVSKEDARRILKQGTDDQGIYYSIFTWAALMYFVSDMWK